MKKLILIAVFAAITGTSIAQVSFGIQGGANMSFGKASTDYKDPLFPSTITNDPKTGFYGGFVAEIPIGMLAFRPELNYIQMGSRTDVKNFLGDIQENKITLNYIQVPLNIVYKVPVGAGHLFFGLGPTIALGVGGKNKMSYPADPSDPDFNRTVDVRFDGKKSDDYENANDADRVHFKRFDVGANAIAGVQLPMGLFFKLGYYYNFMDINPDKDNADESDRASYKNRGLNVGIGFMFGGAKAKKK